MKFTTVKDLEWPRVEGYTTGHLRLPKGQIMTSRWAPAVWHSFLRDRFEISLITPKGDPIWIGWEEVAPADEEARAWMAEQAMTL